MIISLLGYMGCGKSQTAKLLSKKLNFKSIDLDDEIASHCKMSISDIFKNKGELGFRKIEKFVLEQVLDTEENSVISLGGGTPVYYDNMNIILQKTTSFYLRAKIPTLVERLQPQKNERPLIAKLNDDDLPEFIAKHLFERNLFYNKAKYTVSVDEKSTIEIADEIFNILYPPH